MAKNENQKRIIDITGTRPIAFNPDLARALRSITAGLLLSQLLFWWGKGNKKGWIYKTIAEIETETALTRQQQDTAIKILKKHNLIKMRLMGIPAKRHFSIDMDCIVNFLQNRTQSA